MSVEENQAVIRRLFDEVYNDQNLDVLDELVAEDVVNHAAADEHKHGIEGFRHVIEWTYALAPDARSELIDMIAQGDKVACRVRVSGTQEGEIFGIPPTGKSFTAEHVHWHRVVGGKLVERWAVRDAHTARHHRLTGSLQGRRDRLKASIHPSAWKGSSRKSASTIPHNPGPDGPQAPPLPHPRRADGDRSLRGGWICGKSDARAARTGAAP